MFVSFNNFYLGVVELINEEVEGIDIIVFVWIEGDILSVDLNPTIWLLIPKTFWSQEDMRSSRRLLVLILIRFTLDLYLNEIIPKIKYKLMHILLTSATYLFHQIQGHLQTTNNEILYLSLRWILCEIYNLVDSSNDAKLSFVYPHFIRSIVSNVKLYNWFISSEFSW